MQDRIPEKFENEVIKLIAKSESSRGNVSDEDIINFNDSIKSIIKEEKDDLSDEDAGKGAELIGNALAFMLTGKIKEEALPKFTDQEIVTLSDQIRTILAEEKVPVEKHDAFVKLYVENSQKDIENINNLTIEQLESDTFKDLNWSNDLLKLVDFKSESPEASSLISKLQNLDLFKRNLHFALNKTIMLAMQKEMLEEKEKIQREREQQQMQQELLKTFFEVMAQSFEAANEDNQNEEEQESQVSKKFGS